MEVILLADVKKIGQKGQIVKVSDGYAMNFLLPRKLAVIASEKGREIKQEQDAAVKAKFEEDKAKALVIKEQLENIKVCLTAKSGGEGKMFGSISAKDVADALLAQHNIVIDKKKFIGENTVKSFGVTKLKNELFKGVVGTINVEVKEI